MQCLAKCREEVCDALNLKREDVELSMGMSGDFEEAVSAAIPHPLIWAVLHFLCHQRIAHVEATENLSCLHWLPADLQKPLIAVLLLAG